ncbi:MAG: polyribonucleotide nucleotidyltransferase [Candidatus Colwellbacteria bacterium]|nr:polyribonucleotide nucleotidyltransferase [Candidatus Colwellbacteria bacterium]
MEEFSLPLGSKKIIFKVTDWASQASGSVIAQYGDTVVLAAATQSNQARSGIDYFPLLIDYDERFYAGGKIGGSRFIRREGRPSDEAVLTARMIDHALRPLFNQSERRDVQVVVTVLSFDKENDPDIPALLASSLALTLSSITFSGPAGALRLCLAENGNMVINPTYKEREASRGEITVAGIEGKVTTIEVKAKEVGEEEVKTALREGVKHITALTSFQQEIAKKFAPIKSPVITKEQPQSLIRFVREFSAKRLGSSLFRKSDIQVKESIDQLQRELLGEAAKEFGQELLSLSINLFYENVEKIMLEKVLKEGVRPDGRKVDELRSLEAQVGILPRTHGSALFKRGMTHALSVITLGAPGEERWIDTMEEEAKQRYMHHYNFPPFCVGEVSPLRAPSRRELGHGYLAQRALEAVLPSQKDFPYTIRVVSEILSSNGSSSMASACGSSLALMDAGVPITSAVAGVAMGLMYESPDSYKVLTDIQGPEDQNGKMDCKIAGTAKGITAVQMDTKLQGVPLEVLSQTLDQARKARLEILEVMTKAIEKPRSSLSPLAPRVFSLLVDPSKIRFVIGPGGETINRIIAKTGVKIDIEDDGTIFITSPDEAAGASAKEIIEQITRDFKEGDLVKGKVSGMVDFGAFVEIAPGKEGLVHISELADGYVKQVKDVVSLGDMVDVRVIGVDREGKIRLSIKQANRLAPPKEVSVPAKRGLDNHPWTTKKRTKS